MRARRGNQRDSEHHHESPAYRGGAGEQHVLKYREGAPGEQKQGLVLAAIPAGPWMHLFTCLAGIAGRPGRST